MENKNYKARDVHPTVLRLHPDLRDELIRLAAINGRSLSKEIANRLQSSLTLSPGIPTALLSYKTDHTSNGAPVKQESPAYALTDLDQAMLAIFRAMPVEKQLAMLSLFK